MIEIRAQVRAAAPLATTWLVLADQVGMSKWAPGSTTLERIGDPRGVGAIRVVAQWPLRVREQITTVDAPTRLGYKLLSGLPVRDYVGATALTAVDSCTDILWTVSFTSRFPGLSFAVRRVIRALTTALAEEAKRVASQNRGPDRAP